jgi:site-specific DNA-methyltransferase (adenine-specific)
MDKWLNQIICGDCLEVMKELPDKSVDLVVTDPPYNISKAEWDKWKRKEDYIEWMGQIFKECERLLKDNGSFYFFHNDMMQIKNLMQWLENNTKFVFKQFIVWNKRFEGASNKGFLDGFIEVGGLRNYQQMAEYCLYYTFQDETGLTTVMLDTNNFPTMRGYFKELQEYIGLNIKQINAGLRHRKAEHCFYWKTTQWDMPTPETYQQLINIYRIDQWQNFREYEDLRREYEDLRYTFNNQKTHHSVWNYEIAEKQGHITPKPTPLIENIIHHSSNEGDIILDPFLGSGTTAVAAHNTGRFFIGIEKEPKYVEIARKRVEQAQMQQSLFA